VAGVWGEPDYTVCLLRVGNHAAMDAVLTPPSLKQIRTTMGKTTIPESNLRYEYFESKRVSRTSDQ
jgi:hypothetical protein